MKVNMLTLVGLCASMNLALGGEVLASHVAVADTILINGRVITADSDNPRAVTIAEAIAIHDGKIVAVGSNLVIEKYAPAATKRINLKGRTVIPGLIDTHNHLYETSLEEFPWSRGQVPGLRLVRERATSVEEVTAKVVGAIQRWAPELGPGKWLIVDVHPPQIAHAAYGRTITKKELDKWAPDNPVIARTRASAVLNSRAIEAFESFYGQQIPQEYWIDKAAGWSSNYVDFPRCAKIDLVMSDKLDLYAKIFKSVLQINAQTGVTTHATHAQCINGYRVGRVLDRAGEMPIRWAWSDGWGHIFNPRPEEYYKRVPDISGYGSDYFWSIGGNPVNLDGGGIAMCTTIRDVPASVKKREVCADKGAESLRARAMKTMLESRVRVAGHHVAGDAALDLYLDLVEKSGLTPNQISSLHLVADHCHQVRPDQIARAKRLGVTFSCPAAIKESQVVAQDYSPRYLSRVVPVRSMLDAGIKPVMSQFGSERTVRTSPFEDVYAFITRKSIDGVPLGIPEEAVTDRMTLLLMMTRWPARVVLRGDVLGSLESGRWADLVVLNSDPLSVPLEELPKVRPIMTMVGGKIVFEDPEFRGNTLRFNPETGQWERRLVTD